MCFPPLHNNEPLYFAEALPPTFLTRPESITTFVGKSAKFLCTVSGTPVIDVAWQKDGATISPSDHYKITKVENKHVLEISLLTTSDRGIYTCKASNKFGADVCQAEMVIIDKPHFIKVLQSVQSAVNKKIRLECQVDEDRKVRVEWTKDGNKIPPGKDYKVYFEDKIASLEIPLAKLKDSGHYVCTVSNEAGSSSSSASVTVRGKIVLGPTYLSLLQFPLSFFAGKLFPEVKSCCELPSDLPSAPLTSCFFPQLPSSALCVASIFLLLTTSKSCSCVWGRGGRGEEGKRDNENCSSACVVLIFPKVTFCSGARKQSLKALYFKLLLFSFPFSPHPLSSPFLLSSPIPSPPLPFLFLYIFLPIFRTTILCEEGRSVLFTDPG